MKKTTRILSVLGNKEKSMLFFYVRHGDPIYNPDSLTPLGHEQARAVAKRFTAHGLDRIYASSSNRAQLTAQPTCDLLKKQMEILDWANEGLVWQEFTVTLESGRRTWGFYDPKMLVTNPLPPPMSALRSSRTRASAWPSSAVCLISLIPFSARI